MADIRKQSTKRQHTVPQCYLRGFADPQGWFYYFDKLSGHSNRVNVKSATAFENFYDFDPSTLQDPADDPHWVEAMFSLLEGHFKQVLTQFVYEAKSGRVEVRTADSMAHHVAIQWMRTKGYRVRLMEIEAGSIQAWLNHCYERDHPGMPPGKFAPGPGYAQVLQADAIFKDENIFRVAELFRGLYWIICRNPTNIPFYTSDEPVAMKEHPVVNETRVPLPPGIGMEYAFPLNKEFLLVMLDKRMYGQLAHDSGTVAGTCWLP